VRKQKVEQEFRYWAGSENYQEAVNSDDSGALILCNRAIQTLWELPCGKSPIWVELSRKYHPQGWRAEMTFDSWLDIYLDVQGEGLEAYRNTDQWKRLVDLFPKEQSDFLKRTKILGGRSYLSGRLWDQAPRMTMHVWVILRHK